MPVRWRSLFAVLALVLTIGGAATVGRAAAATPEWNIERVGAPATAAGVVVAVIDTGVDANHPTLAGRVLPEIVAIDDGATGDPHGHGTHVAGTIAGADAGCGNIGVAPDAVILPVRALDAEGTGDLGDVAAGIRAAADAGAQVINLSLGGDIKFRGVTDGSFRQAVEYAWSRGAIPVLAAGNDAVLGGLLGSGYGDLHAVVVTATDFADRRPSYATSAGNAVGHAKWAIAAPGGDDPGTPDQHLVLSAYPGGRCAGMVGTSMAAPHVSAALAALLAAGHGPASAVDRMLSTARDLGDSATYGAGLLDVRAAIGTAVPRPEPVAGTAAPAITVVGQHGGSDGVVAPTTGLGAPTSTAAATERPGAPKPTAVPPVSVDESAASVPVGESDDAGAPTGLVLVTVAALVGVAATVGLVSRSSSCRAREPRPPAP